ncbi:class I SAM-dependent methyltransferase [Streptomyces sp. NBC_01320]|uniref:class I SAM-dependent methyltransferase n=1 Tax=Streptomyces sp. NBC_01320 TaxID=2903824 RepID=UPI002E0F6122|nr:class I SAM-dependent methyltransferase [Streptomyces sp. NBC_01320]
MAPTPHNVSYISYAPNHVRVFRNGAYEQVGGYDATRTVLDDQDLMCRLFQVGDFHLIPRCLYLQRQHPHNTQRDTEVNAHIQRETVALYDKYVEANALAWTKRRGLLALDLGAAHRKPPGYLGVDQRPRDGVDIVATLPGPLDFPDDSVGLLRAVDFLEHVPAKIPLINELYRLLAPGGMLLSRTPSSTAGAPTRTRRTSPITTRTRSGNTPTTSTAPSYRKSGPASSVHGWSPTSRPTGTPGTTSLTCRPI